MKKTYVCGFLFSVDGKHVALIKKLRGPGNMKGHLNGIGGKVKNGEHPFAAMVREFQEETGVSGLNWKEFLIADFDGGTVHFYVSHDEKVFQVDTITDENVLTFPTSMVHNPHNSLYPNLRWIIPLALDTEILKGIIKP